MYRIILIATGETLKDGFKTLKEADDWHENWCDTWSEEDLDNDYLRVRFEFYSAEASFSEVIQ